jgi:hypothetical protein
MGQTLLQLGSSAVNNRMGQPSLRQGKSSLEAALIQAARHQHGQQGKWGSARRCALRPWRNFEPWDRFCKTSFRPKLFEKIFTLKFFDEHRLCNTSGLYEQYSWILRYFKATKGYAQKLNFDQIYILSVNFGRSCFIKSIPDGIFWPYVCMYGIKNSRISIDACINDDTGGCEQYVCMYVGTCFDLYVFP